MSALRRNDVGGSDLAQAQDPILGHGAKIPGTHETQHATRALLGSFAIAPDIGAEASGDAARSQISAILVSVHNAALEEAIAECGPVERYETGASWQQAIMAAFGRHEARILNDKSHPLHRPKRQIEAHIKEQTARASRMRIAEQCLTPAEQRQLHLENAVYSCPELGSLAHLLASGIDTRGAEALERLATLINHYVATGDYGRQDVQSSTTFGDPATMARHLTTIATFDPAFLSALMVEKASMPGAPPRRHSFLHHLEEAMVTDHRPALLPSMIRSLKLVAKLVTDISYNTQEAQAAKQADAGMNITDAEKTERSREESLRLFTLFTHGLGSQPNLFLHLANACHNAQFAMGKLGMFTPIQQTAIAFMTLTHDFMGKNTAHTLYYTTEVQEHVVRDSEMMAHIFQRLPHIAKSFHQLDAGWQHALTDDPALMREFLTGHWREIGELMERGLYNTNRPLFKQRVKGRDEYGMIIRRHDTMAARGSRRLDIPVEFTLGAEFHHTPHCQLDALLCVDHAALERYLERHEEHLCALNSSAERITTELANIRLFYQVQRPRLEEIAKNALFFTSVEDLLMGIYVTKAADVYDAFSRINQRGRSAPLIGAAAMLEMALHAGNPGEQPPQFVAGVIDPLLRNYAKAIRREGDATFNISPRSHSGLTQQHGGVGTVAQRMDAIMQIVWEQDAFALSSIAKTELTVALTEAFSLQAEAMQKSGQRLGGDPYNAPEIAVVFGERPGQTIIEVSYNGITITIIKDSNTQSFAATA